MDKMTFIWWRFTLAEAESRVATEPMEVDVPLMTPFNPLVKKPPMPLAVPSTTMLITCTVFADQHYLNLKIWINYSVFWRTYNNDCVISSCVRQFKLSIPEEGCGWMQGRCCQWARCWTWCHWWCSHRRQAWGCQMPCCAALRWPAWW